MLHTKRRRSLSQGTWSHLGVFVYFEVRNCFYWNFYYPPCRFRIFKLYNSTSSMFMVGLLVVLRINVDLAIFQPYLDLKGGENQSLKI